MMDHLTLRIVSHQTKTKLCSLYFYLSYGVREICHIIIKSYTSFIKYGIKDDELKSSKLFEIKFLFYVVHGEKSHENLATCRPLIKTWY